MREARPVVIVMARCEADQSASFGVRIERETGATWSATWAFAMRESVARREGYDETRIQGSFRMGEGYPGCPACGAHGMRACGSCGQTACWNGSIVEQVCPWCGVHARVAGEITAMHAGGDR